jgi:hypothetical protein
MLLLRLDVLANNANIRPAHSESTVSLLPPEFRDPHVLMYPSRGRLLDLAQNVGQAMRRAKTQEEVDMIRDAADLFGYAVERLHTTSQDREPVAARLSALATG